jgi:hypothetical protein
MFLDVGVLLSKYIDLNFNPVHLPFLYSRILKRVASLSIPKSMHIMIFVCMIKNALHGIQKTEKDKNFKKCRQSTQLAERFKTSTISWGFGGLIHGRVASVLNLHLGRGFESQPELKFSIAGSTHNRVRKFLHFFTLV